MIKSKRLLVLLASIVFVSGVFISSASKKFEDIDVSLINSNDNTLYDNQDTSNDAIPVDQLKYSMPYSDYNMYDENVLIKVDRTKIIISDEVELPEDFPPIPLNSYALTESQTYEKWVRTYAVYYPRFTNEIKYEGSEAIKQYYEERVKYEKPNSHWEMEDEVLEGATMKHHYYCQSYDVDFYDKYLSVLYFGTWYGGGAHSIESYTADNFDMVSGKILTLIDLFGDEQIYRPVLNKLICKQILNLNIQTVPIDESTDIISYTRAGDIQFRIVENGIEFIFQNYDISSYAQGAIFVTVPYDELKSLLIINI